MHHVLGSKTIMAAIMSAFVLAGCEGPASEISGDAVSDSAGVRMVQLRAGLPDQPLISVAPLYHYGNQGGQYEFTFVGSGDIYNDGRAIVLDAGSQELLLLDVGGSTHEILARQGGGPGELRRAFFLRTTAADTAYVGDPGNQKVIRFVGQELDQTFSTATLREMGSQLQPVEVVAPDQILMVTGGYNSRHGQPWLEGRVHRASLESGQFDTIGVFDLAPSRPDQGINPFAPFGFVVGAGSHIVQTRSDQPRVVWRGHDGEVTQIVDWQAEPTYPTAAALDGFVAGMRETLKRVNPGMPEAQLNEFVANQISTYELQTETAMPVFGLSQGSHSGEVWLSGPPTTPEPWFSTYYVLGADGKWRGRVDFEQPVRVLAIRDSLALAAVRDDLGVQSVRMYRIGVQR